MKPFCKLLFVCFYIFNAFDLQAQQVDAALLQKQWKASWIEVPGQSATGYGVYLFRKTMELPSKPVSFVVHVSADNRYKLFVNEKLVSLGPARGDLNHWNFETVDIASYLRTGSNIIAAQVWNDGDWRPEAQISLQTAFILQGDADAAQMINSNSSWKCIRDSSYQPLRVSLATYYVAGPGEQINMATHIKNWQKLNYDDAVWKAGKTLFTGNPKTILGEYGTPGGWLLVPSAIPQMEQKLQRMESVRKAEGVSVGPSFPATKTAVIIPANTTASILVDQSFLTNAYPTLVFSGGKGGGISLTYSESLFTKYPTKNNRNEIGGKIIYGRKDSLIPDGTSGQTFISLSWRTFRYIQIRITTREDPLVIEDLYGTFTGYPFQFNAQFETADPEYKKMLDIGWRTARLCAVETYMDCPYYEQLQYIGDARIQGLVSLYNSGDDRLLRNALNQMDNSRLPEGVTLSRHPSYTPQYIPTFSLWYIGMLHDYMMYGPDSSFISKKLAGERQVLSYFRSYQQVDGSLKNVPYWMFTDWVEFKGWVSGAAPVGKEGSSALLDLQLLWAYQTAADMENKMGMKAYTSLYMGYAAQLKKTIRNKYWDAGKKLFADRPEKDLFSQHANALAILTGIFTGDEATAVAKKILLDTALAPASVYFKYYLHQACTQAGLGNDYSLWLDKWRENLSLGLTTWAEMSDVNNSRSDCHAWGASPNIEFFRTLLGIDSDAPGFGRVKIEPHLGIITDISGEIPHPRGKISVRYLKKNNQWATEINLPEKTTGTFIWKKKTYPLKPGVNNLQVQ